MIYGYCRISTPKQSIERQVRNILKEYPDAHIVKEVYTGTRTEGRTEFEKLLRAVKPGDTIVYDSVSRMSRNAEEGFTDYTQLYEAGVTLVFLKEPAINTATYKEALSKQIPLTGGDVDLILEGVNRYMLRLAEIQIRIAFEQAEKGKILFEGRDITDLNTQKIVETGIAMVPEGRRVFANLTVLENLRIGAYLRKDKEAIEEDINYVYDLFPRLKERSWQLAGTLSGGEQQMLAVGRAVMTRPKLIMMDEPSLGLAPLVVKDIFKIIQTLKGTGMTVLLIEQNANAALHACDYAYVMETGRITTSGTGEELLASEAIQEAYLGKTSKS